jgi:hypothetical protein
MSAQYDYQPGTDFSGKPNIELVDLVQAIFGIAPLINIGGVIYGSTTPDVTGNPRFKRYVWLDSATDPPTPKYYDTGTLTWDANSVADNAVTAAKIADAAVTILDGGGNADRIARAYNGAVDATKANHILRLDANGQYVEIASFATLFTAGVVPLTAINKVGVADGQVLQYATSDGLVAWRTLSLATTIADHDLGLAKLATAAVGYILKMGASDWGGVAPKSVFTGADEDNSAYLTAFGTGAFAPLNASGGAAATALQVPQRNSANTATIWSTPIFRLAFTEVDGTAISGRTNSGWTVAHNLGVIPKLVVIRAYCSAADGTYSIGDEIDACLVSSSAAGAAIGVGNMTTSLINLKTTGGAAYDIPPLTGGALVAMTEANWNWKVYVYA